MAASVLPMFTRNPKIWTISRYQRYHVAERPSVIGNERHSEPVFPTFKATNAPRSRREAASETLLNLQISSFSKEKPLVLLNVKFANPVWDAGIENLDS